LLGNAEATEKTAIFLGVTGNIILTVGLSVVVSYGLVLLFQKLDTNVKLFLLIAVLLLLYSIGKLFHLSSLVIILVFGIILNNHQLFFRGFLKKMIDTRAVYGILHNFRLVTMESAFVMRTFFFVIFGITISVSALLDVNVALISLLLVALFLLIRFVLLKLVVRKDILPQLFIAPRGLITILLFFSIPVELQVSSFNSGILLFVVLITSFAMTFALVLSGKKIQPYDDFADDYWEQVDEEIDTIPTQEKQAIDEKLK
jgi:NhaP-type Na+/H+ or K+/H+ antiporter